MASAAALVSELHGFCLREICKVIRTDFDGLTTAARAARRAGHISNNTCKRLTQLDTTFAFNRHIHEGKVAAFQGTLLHELASLCTPIVGQRFLEEVRSYDIHSADGDGEDDVTNIYKCNWGISNDGLDTGPSGPEPQVSRHGAQFVARELRSELHNEPTGEVHNNIEKEVLRDHREDGPPLRVGPIPAGGRPAGDTDKLDASNEDFDSAAGKFAPFSGSEVAQSLSDSVCGEEGELVTVERFRELLAAANEQLIRELRMGFESEGQAGFALT